jgi:hypothetical protein
MIPRKRKRQNSGIVSRGTKYKWYVAIIELIFVPFNDGQCSQTFSFFFLQQKVTSGDILKERDAEGNSNDMAEGVLIITRSAEQSATVPNCCIICLETYKTGDTVVWASNQECQHAFHRKCIVKYLIKIQKKVAATPCPCCRQRFTDLDVEERKKKRRFRSGFGLSHRGPLAFVASFF